ncbi:4'-phosphopantetheinyl transferase superfamily protein (plasmid) [Skermanella sp. TT6]|uniref:4'-phosphopantetheinyl transferase superfamily protein n=1 Tax=Skermanella cutis TaxID=2775420 RepID=A0ABX7BHX1_9PROT|nr:4'-phosphopantetheinyl transferase superfamily protein [Skermanella sp. TT6]QQP93684.1 4'-phosphopantetheinyl transferase superfamily protein [Skermanella sp. TT6]
MASASGNPDIYYVVSDAPAVSDLSDAYRSLLAPEEMERYRRYLNDRARHEYLVTRALVRTVLSRYADVPPAAWRFRSNAHGRPEIAGPALPGRDLSGLRFNLSNTNGLVACAVAAGCEIGIDVENLERAGDVRELADRFLAPAEAADLRSLPPAGRSLRFFTYWTLKEAYVKARGLGLSIPLDGFALDLADPARIRIAFEPGLDDAAARWSFATFRPTGNHLMAVAVGQPPGRPPAPDLQARLIPVVPLADRPG